jgi:autophagy-related protein 2
VSEEIIGAATDPELQPPSARAPAIMARMIGDELEPVVKIKLWNVKIEYRVPTLLTLLGLLDSASPQDMSASLAASVATLTDFARSKAPQVANPQTSSSSTSKPMAVDIVMRDCILGLNPLGLPSKLLVVLTEAHLDAVLPKDQNTSASMELSKASLLIIDNVAYLVSGDLSNRPRRHSFDGGSSQVADLCAMGYVSVSYISSAKAIVLVTAGEEAEHSVDVELRDDLFVLETCADSTQTLIAILDGLAPPSIPSKETKYRTKVIPVPDLLASLSGDAFGTAEGDYNFDDDFGLNEGSEAEDFGGDGPEDLDFDSHFYQQDGDEEYNEAILEDKGGLSASTQLSTRDTHDGVLLESFIEQEAEEDFGELDFQENHFGTGSVLEGTAHKWNSTKNTYDHSNASKVRKSPLKVCVRDVHIIWNLFDGYDWQNTRDTITKAVQDVESKAIERRARNDRHSTFDQDIDDEDTVIGDFLFNSIYIGIPGNRDPRELAAAINQEVNDNATETESTATTYMSSSPSRQGSARKPKSKKLRLNRSKHHKITFELRGVSVDLVTFPPGTGETQSSVDIRVHDFEIFDHVPTSTWRKFVTYMQDAGERESGTSMIHLEILNVKPIPDLAASEIVLKATVLPLRLHVDQDALDFITRFFEFKEDPTAPSHPSPGEVPFIQRAEVNSVQVKLDFKPKRVDYSGLRSGHTTEFMNFIILDEADMVLRHTIIYGISGFDKLGKCLNDIWMPDIKRNQLPGILAGLAPVRSLVNVGGGFRHLVTVPIKEYKKDGRIVRGISKGASAFAKTTGTELVKLGAKVAIGVQTVLQGAEGFLGPTMDTPIAAVEEDDSEEDTKKISLYANQPVGVLQGLRGGYKGLRRDLVSARDAIIAVPGEVMESGNAAGVLKAVRKHAPTVILRPAIGVAKAGGQILMGATNSLDPVNLQRADAVSISNLEPKFEPLALTYCCRNIKGIDEVMICLHR